MQSARTSQMIFDVPRTIEFLSSFTTLRPGDVIATGTPGGVGFARQPPVWLEAGDTLEITVEGVGRIASRVVAEERDGRAAWPWHPPVKTGATF
jgi:acylpyruvate hydrolase